MSGSGNTPFAAVDSDVSPALLPLASQQAVAVSTTVSAQTVDRGTTFPAAPADKDEYHYVASPTDGIVWRFKYNAGSASSYKWEFVGGPPLVSYVATAQSTTSTAYAALGTAGPLLILPFAGDYDVSVGATIAAPLSSAIGSESLMSYDIGGTGASDSDSVEATAAVNSATAVGHSLTFPQRKTGLTAVTLTAKYKSSSGGTSFFSKRWMAVTPARVSG